MGGGPRVKGIRGCGLAVVRKKGSILRFPLKLLWEKCPAGMASRPKEVRMSWNHLMHALEVDEGEA